MAIIKSLISALSTYSKIPMPNISYKEGDGRLTLCFFPLVGLIIAGLQYVWFLIGWRAGLDKFITDVGVMVIPLLVTGGIHLDGFMDSMDAIHSYQPKEKKLSILSDPHIGAFCVIKLVELIAIWFICVHGTLDLWFKVLIAGFIVSRILSGLSIRRFELAKDTGMVAYTRNNSSYACDIVLLLELIAVAVYLICEFGWWTLILFGVSLICLVYYKFKVEKDFGGITGDTSGCFLVMVETAWLLTTFILNVWWMV